MTPAIELEYADYIERLSGTHPELAAHLSDVANIEQVVQWLTARGVGLDGIDLVGMDEFSYDFLVRPGPGDEWLSFGVT